MKTRTLRAKIIGPILLLIPMACMHLSDGHHASMDLPSYQYSVDDPAPVSTIEDFTAARDCATALEETQTQPESEKGG